MILGKGGVRPGAGRKKEDPSGKTRRVRALYVTDEEFEILKANLKAIRQQAKEAKELETYE